MTHYQHEQPENPEVFPRKSTDGSAYYLLIGVAVMFFLFLTMLGTDKPSAESSSQFFQSENEEPAEQTTDTLDIGVVP